MRRRRLLISIGILIILLLILRGCYLQIQERRRAEEERVIEAYWCQVYFGPTESGDENGLDNKLTELISQAERSVQSAFYDLDLQNVTDALLDDYERGVEVGLVTDSDNITSQIEELREAGIKVVEDERGAIMHDKFCIVDERYVWTGSFNVTENGAYKNDNNVVLIDSEELAQNFLAEFAEMYKDKEFGSTSPNNTNNPELTISGFEVETYFSPEDKPQEVILEELEKAEKNIYFAAFSFTDDEIGDLMIEKHKEGIEISGIFEKRQISRYSEYKKMEGEGMDVYLDANKYIMHHKFIIIDEEVVITGSYNFTTSAKSRNDENLLIIHDPKIAKIYYKEFLRLRESAKSAED